MKQYLLQLMLAKGIGDAAIKRILHFASQNSKYTLRYLCENLNETGRIFNFKAATLESIQLNAEYAQKLVAELSKHEIEIISEIDDRYPTQLRETLGVQCPPVLFAQGNLDLLFTKSVGFCGSRKVSPKGIGITEQCAQQLVQKGITVVSGYASGTDLAAHTSAINNGGNTVFVLAEGILRFSKKQAVRNLLTPQNHLYVSQFLPDAQWNAGNAMKRNAIIIGLSKAMILVESGKTGGTFAAGEETLARHLPLFVIDYAQPEVSAEANPYFISRGGMPIRGSKGIPNLEKVFSVVDTSAYAPGSYEQLSLNLND